MYDLSFAGRAGGGEMGWLVGGLVGGQSPILRSHHNLDAFMCAPDGSGVAEASPEFTSAAASSETPCVV